MCGCKNCINVNYKDKIHSITKLQMYLKIGVTIQVFNSFVIQN